MWLTLMGLLLAADAAGAEAGGPRDRLLAREPLAVTERDDEIGRLKKQRFNAALLDAQSRQALWRGGKSNFGDVQAAADRLLKAELSLCRERAEHIKVLQQHVAIAEVWLEIQTHMCDAGIVPVCDRELARYWQLDLKLALAELQQP